MLDDPAHEDLRSAAPRLFLLGFVGLFLELVLIRYLAGSIWNLGYFPNLVLIAAFMGMGIGFVFHQLVSSRRSPLVFHSALGLLFLLVLFVSVARPSVPGFAESRGSIGGELFFTYIPTDPSPWDPYLFPLWFVAIVSIFALFSQRTAKLFGRFRPLHAYSLDIGGSCVGIMAFMAISWMELPAWSWFLVLVPVWLVAMPPAGWRMRVIPTLLLAAIAAIAWNQDQSLLSDPDVTENITVRWSPYQKVEHARFSPEQQTVYVNGVGHQHLMTPDKLRESFYDVPYRYRLEVSKRAPYKRVLIIGAGTGNDVAAALRRGAKHVDAVEIDPAIARFGRLHHVARPYQDPRVKLIVDDGRAFMTRSDGGYDLIIFALTDSLVKVSALSQLRLENYIFTVESIRRAYSLLTEDGDLFFYNSYREDWLLAKIQETITRASGRSPRIIGSNRDFHMLAVGRAGDAAESPDGVGARIDVPTDDWPFLYLERRGIPGIYKVAMAGLAATVVALMFALQRFTRNLEAGVSGRPRLFLKIAFVLMGLAFLLLETKGVTQFSLLFGTTWKNNSLVFLAALLLVLAANALAFRVKGTRLLPAAFGLLMASCLITLVYPLSKLLGVQHEALRFVLASLLVFSPIFFANLIFSLAFRDQVVAEHLFGWNLIGTTLGGVVEYSSMQIGYNALAVVVAITYALAFASFYAARRAAASDSAP